jgi:hypothetical protein
VCNAIRAKQRNALVSDNSAQILRPSIQDALGGVVDGGPDEIGGEEDARFFG